jgi:pyruvate kinase
LLTLQNDSNFPFSVINHPRVAGARVNTASKQERTPDQLVNFLKSKLSPKKLWIDLKCRELRITEDAVVPKDRLRLSHPIDVNLPVRMYYNQGSQYLIVSEIIDGDQLVIKNPSSSPADFNIEFGVGASVNICDPSLKIDGFLTEKDRLFIEAAKKSDIHNYMASYVEKVADIEDILTIDDEACIVAKIESINGLEFVKKDYDKCSDIVRLMAARGDLYIEIDRPHQILKALRLIINKDKQAIYASRMLESIDDQEGIPKCVDIIDIGYGLELGYRSFLLGDDICSNEFSLKNAVGLLDHIFNDQSR